MPHRRAAIDADILLLFVGVLWIAVGLWLIPAMVDVNPSLARKWGWARPVFIGFGALFVIVGAGVRIRENAAWRRSRTRRRAE